jgi:hypothetical protein
MNAKQKILLGWSFWIAAMLLTAWAVISPSAVASAVPLGASLVGAFSFGFAYALVGLLEGSGSGTLSVTMGFIMALAIASVLAAAQYGAFALVGVFAVAFALVGGAQVGTGVREI